MTTSSTKSRRKARPRADKTCTLSRTVERNGITLGVWTCSAPSPRPWAPGPDLRRARPEVFEKVGRRKWRFFFVDPSDAADEDSELSEPGWYFQAKNPDATWINNDPAGPYKTIDDAREDLRTGIENSEGAL
jgi:hypothetical protein